MTTDGSRGTIHRLLRATEELQAIPPSDFPLGFLLISRVLSVLFWLGPRWKTIFFAIVGAAPRFQVPSRAVDVGRQTESKFQLVVQQTRQNPLSASPNPDLPTSTQVGRHHRIASRTPGLPLFFPLSPRTQTLRRVHPVLRRQRPTDHSLVPPRTCSPNRRWPVSRLRAEASDHRPLLPPRTPPTAAMSTKQRRGVKFNHKSNGGDGRRLSMSEVSEEGGRSPTKGRFLATLDGSQEVGLAPPRDHHDNQC